MSSQGKKHGRKRQAPLSELGSRVNHIFDEVDDGSLDEKLCWFCQQSRVALRVKLPHPRFPKSKKITRSLCLLHYYTTPTARIARTPIGQITTVSSVSRENNRSDPGEQGDVEILDQKEFDSQLKPMQEMFADAFLQVQQEIAEASARAFTTQQHDPLAILHNLNKKSRRTLKKPPVPSTSTLDSNAGGFLREVALPERLIRTHEKQARLHRDMENRMQRAASAAAHAETKKQHDFS